MVVVDCGFWESWELTRTFASTNLLASKAGFGKLICPGKFSLFLFLLISIEVDCGDPTGGRLLTMVCAFLLESNILLIVRTCILYIYL